MPYKLRSTSRRKFILLLVLIGLVWALPAQARLLPQNFPFTSIAEEKSAAVKTLTPEVALNEFTVYRVQRGDNLLSIARRYQVDPGSLARLNGIAEPDYIQAGQKIKIPNRENPAVSPSRTLEWTAGLDEGLSWINPSGDQADSRDREQWQWPLSGPITLAYGAKDRDGFHHGLDIAAPAGDPIRAAAGGEVTFSGRRPVYGLTVIIKHHQGLATLYAHASRLLVQEGDQVFSGQEIARVGSTGHSSGPHLHFEVYRNGRTVNPLRYLPAR